MHGLEFDILSTDQVFSYWMDTELLHFNVSLLDRIRKAAPTYFRLIDMPITQEIYDLCMVHRGIEEPRVAKLAGKHLREPGYVCLWNMHTNIPDYTVVDGHHRLVRRFRGGIRSMQFWATPEYIWRQVLMPATKEENEFIASQIPERVVDPVGIIHEYRVKRENH